MGKLPLRHNGEMNLVDLHNRDNSHRVLQLGSVYVPTNSLDHEKLAAAPRKGCRRNLMKPFWSHTGRDAEHPGPDEKEENTAQDVSSPVKPANSIIVLLDTDLPAGLPTTKENTQRGVKPAIRALHMPLSGFRNARNSFWFTTAMMPSI